MLKKARRHAGTKARREGASSPYFRPLRLCPGAPGFILFLLLANVSQSQVIFPGRPQPGNRRINLPYQTSDNTGNVWFIYSNGAIQQQAMGQPIYAQGANLTVDGPNFNVPNNQGALDPKTGELILENPDINGIAVTRRILFNKADGYVRYLDVYRNPQKADHSVNMMLQSIMNFGVQENKLIPDPQHKDRNIAWTGVTGAGRSVLELYAGPGGKQVPTIAAQEGNNVVSCNLNFTLPAGKEMVVAHFHAIVASMDDGQKFVANFKSEKAFKDVPAALRREIINFTTNAGWLPELEVLRGDVFDIVELRGGDQYKGTLKPADYSLDTFYGPMHLPADRVVAMLNAGQSKPRQLLVTSDGQVFGGHLNTPGIDLALTSGQVLTIPLSQITRVGYRKQPGESEQTPDRPTVLLRGGDRLAVDPPANKIQIATRYGLLSLDASTIASINFLTDESGVHEINLTDGTKISGLLATDTLDMKLSAASIDAPVHFPVAMMLRLQLTKPAEVDAEAPTLSLLNGDQLYGSLQGTLKLQTSFDQITLDGGQIRRITRDATETTGDAQVTLWDGSLMTGQLSGSNLSYLLLSGVELSIPSPLLSKYDQPHPLPSADMVKQIQSAAADLGAEDWRQRDRAEANLTTMGPAVIGVLRTARPKLDAEAQQRIDGIIKKLEFAEPKTP
jgi:hypothetical protein